MLKGALICCFVFWVANMLQQVFLLNVSYSPICLCTFLGILVGKPTEGLVMGGYLQAIFLGVMAIGGVTPANKQLGSIIPCAYVLLGDLDLEAGLAIAYTIGVLTNTFNNLINPIFAATEPWWQKTALKGEGKKYSIAHWVWLAFIKNTPQMILLFCAVYFGTDAVSTVVGYLPDKFMNGLSVASSCLTAVGIAIAIKMTWKVKYCGFFFIGWALYYILGLTQIQCALIAVSIAMIWYFASAEIDQKISKAAPAIADQGGQQGGEFF